MRKKTDWMHFVLLGMVLLVFGWVVGCGGEEATPTPTKPGVVATPTPVTTPPPATGVRSATVTELINTAGNGLFDPTRIDEIGLQYGRMFQTSLMEETGKSGGITPGIAKSWEMSPDGKAWTFTIRDGVKAHNGEAINVDDVFGSLDSRFGAVAKVRIAAGELTSTTLTTAQGTQSVEKVDPDKVRITMKEPRPDLAYFLSSAGYGPYGFIIPMDYWNQVGKDGYEAKPVGVGPFKVVSFIPQQEIVFERFDDYYYQPKNGFPEDRRPKFTRLIQRIVPEAATRSAALQAGQADLIQANLFMLTDIEKAGGKVVYTEETNYLRFIFRDCWTPDMWCYKKEVRQALEYAIDKETLVQQLYGPKIAVVKGWAHVTPNAMGYLPGVTDPFPYDVKKAKELLAQAGFPEGKGLPVIKMYTFQADELPLVVELASAVASGWRKQLGLQIEVVVSDATSFGARSNARQLPGIIEFRPNEARYNGLGITRSQYFSPTSVSRVCDPVAPDCVEMAKLVGERMLQPADPATLFKNYQEVYTVLRDNSRNGSLFYVNTPWGLGPRVKDYKPWPLMSYTTAIWTLELK
ncbi:MAG: ABC transporter substrate-binding protein [Dehalococcoidia bacterium]|nr:ABC transporter substrate-binding protein [Dehalococcoidia bacterium]